MAEFRSVHSKIWDRKWFAEMDSDGKLLWIYLITNSRASVSGIYCLPRRILSSETGISESKIDDCLNLYKSLGKIQYEDDVIWLTRMREYQETQSPKLQKGIKSDFDKIPSGLVKTAYSIRYGYPIDTVSIPQAYDTIRYDTRRDEIPATADAPQSDDLGDGEPEHHLKTAPVVMAWRIAKLNGGQIRSFDWPKALPLIKQLHEHPSFNVDTPKEEIAKWIAVFEEDRKTTKPYQFRYFLEDIIRGYDAQLGGGT